MPVTKKQIIAYGRKKFLEIYEQSHGLTETQAENIANVLVESILLRGQSIPHPSSLDLTITNLKKWMDSGGFKDKNIKIYPTKEEIVTYGKRKIMELYGESYGVNEKQAEHMAEALITGIWSRGGDVVQLDGLDEDIGIIVKRWLEGEGFESK